MSSNKWQIANSSLAISKKGHWLLAFGLWGEPAVYLSDAVFFLTGLGSGSLSSTMIFFGSCGLVLAAGVEDAAYGVFTPDSMEAVTSWI